MHLPNKFPSDLEAEKWIKEFTKAHPDVIVEKRNNGLIKIEWKPEGEESSRLKVRFIKIGEKYG